MEAVEASARPPIAGLVEQLVGVDEAALVVDQPQAAGGGVPAQVADTLAHHALAALLQRPVLHARHPADNNPVITRPARPLSPRPTVITRHTAVATIKELFNTTDIFYFSYFST